MDRKTLGRFKKMLEDRREQLRDGLSDAHQPVLGGSAETGKDEGDRALASLSRNRSVATGAPPIAFGTN